MPRQPTKPRKRTATKPTNRRPRSRQSPTKPDIPITIAAILAELQTPKVQRLLRTPQPPGKPLDDHTHATAIAIIDQISQILPVIGQILPGYGPIAAGILSAAMLLLKHALEGRTER
jgi:hypothetical protein